MIPAPQTPSSLIWFKSSYSGAGTTECVEAARLPQATAVRDSKSPAGPVVVFSQSSWSGFLSAVRLQKLDG